jgi:cardiolipin synthase
VRRACRERSGRLLAAGVHVFEYQPTMFHRKCMIVDGLWCSVGSSNFDNRSFRLNDEANLNVLDAGFAAIEMAHFAADRALSREVTHAEWLGRPRLRKLADKLAALSRSQI